jgi:hypothetical protein
VRVVNGNDDERLIKIIRRQERMRDVKRSAIWAI